MAHVFSFSTDAFDPAKEPPNEHNPIAGHAVLAWLSEKLNDHGYVVGAPASEDWGWYADVTHDGTTYMLGASGEPPERGSLVDWVVQLTRHRTLKDKLLGRNKLAPDDALSTAIERILRGDSRARDVTIDREAARG